MSQMPTLGQFIKRAQDEYGAELKTVDSRGPRGVVSHRYLVCNQRIAVLPYDLEDDECLTPRILRSLCVRLGIEPKEFGLLLG